MNCTRLDSKKKHEKQTTPILCSPATISSNCNIQTTQNFVQSTFNYHSEIMWRQTNRVIYIMHMVKTDAKKQSVSCNKLEYSWCRQLNWRVSCGQRFPVWQLLIKIYCTKSHWLFSHRVVSWLSRGDVC